MNLVSSVAVAVLTLAQEVPEPEDVKAGWLGLTVFGLLLLAVALLGLSLRKHMRRVNFEEQPDGEPGPGNGGAGSASR